MAPKVLGVLACTRTCVCMCVCVKEREQERETQRETERAITKVSIMHGNGCGPLKLHCD